jgi:hypothetical protein
MTQDNIYAYAHFTVIGGCGDERNAASSLRIFASHEAALDYARDLVNSHFDHAYVMGVGADGVPDLANVANVVRVADVAQGRFIDLR